MPTKPYSLTHFSSSGMQVAGSTPGDCGSIAAGDEVVGEQLADAEAQLVADRGPGRGDVEVADVMRHEAGARAEEREVAAALLHQLQLVVSMDSRSSSSLIFRSLTLASGGRILDAGDLPVAPVLQRLRRRGVVAVARR